MNMDTGVGFQIKKVTRSYQWTFQLLDPAFWFDSFLWRTSNEPIDVSKPIGRASTVMLLCIGYVILSLCLQDRGEDVMMIWVWLWCACSRVVGLWIKIGIALFLGFAETQKECSRWKDLMKTPSRSNAGCSGIMKIDRWRSLKIRNDCSGASWT